MKMLKKTQKKKGKKEKEATTQQYEDVESFFTIFKTEGLEDPEAEADVGQEEEEAEFITDDLLPFALNYYLNIMPVDDECCSDEEDDEDADDKHHGHGHGGGKKKGKGGEESKEKCKNQ